MTDPGPDSDELISANHVRSLGTSCLEMLTVSVSHFDPELPFLRPSFFLQDTKIGANPKRENACDAAAMWGPAALASQVGANRLLEIK
jgi:hypothetical protein